MVTGIVSADFTSLAAIRAGKDLALANKETLIAAGPVVLPELKKSSSRLLPADSEHRRSPPVPSGNALGR